MKIHVFDVDKLARRVLDRTWRILGAKSAENDPNLAPQDDPKSIKNRVQKMIKILIDFKTAGMRFLARPGGMRKPPGGILGGKKTPPKKICSNMLATSAKLLATWATSATAIGDLTHRDLAPTGRAADPIASRIPPDLLMIY